MSGDGEGVLLEEIQKAEDAIQALKDDRAEEVLLRLWARAEEAREPGSRAWIDSGAGWLEPGAGDPVDWGGGAPPQGLAARANAAKNPRNDRAAAPSAAHAATEEPGSTAR